MLLALTARPTEPGAHGELIAAIASDPAAEVDSSRSAQRRGSCRPGQSGAGPDAADAFCEACHRASGGNPFVLHDLLSELRFEGIAPTAAAAADVAGSPPRRCHAQFCCGWRGCRRRRSALAQATAVLGDGADLRDAAALAGIDIPVRRWRRRTRSPTPTCSRPGRPLSFVHPLTRAAIYTDLPVGKRSKAHQRRRSAARRTWSGSGRNRRPPSRERPDGRSRDRRAAAGRCVAGAGARDARSLRPLPSARLVGAAARPMRDKPSWSSS